MIDDGTYTAVLDRFEGEQAVLVLEQDGQDVTDYPVPAERLPEAGRQQDAVFDVAIEGGDLVDITYDPGETKSRRESAQQRFDRLSKRPPKRDE
ncbi:hypothetical protein GCM10009037_24300 [Halarchaeum grantii]|uniref:DUF3006 family protein n=1 Tax=Halarchaeum grantii TaxID=1193105 RepID=A0A830F4K4_9EURY|nr:DUF3006 domain-containing protein [Halarchaeum grantii]GGL39694.1 hypothetical protein GCM10009037_24300 [Halarchaeum grantii]